MKTVPGLVVLIMLLAVSLVAGKQKCDVEGEVECPEGMWCFQGVCQNLVQACDGEGQANCTNGQFCYDHHCDNFRCAGEGQSVCAEGDACHQGYCESANIYHCDASADDGCGDIYACLSGICEKVPYFCNEEAKCPEGEDCYDGVCDGLRCHGDGQAQCPAENVCHLGYCEKVCANNTQCDDDNSCLPVAFNNTNICVAEQTCDVEGGILCPEAAWCVAGKCNINPTKCDDDKNTCNRNYQCYDNYCDHQRCSNKDNTTCGRGRACYSGYCDTQHCEGTGLSTCPKGMNCQSDRCTTFPHFCQGEGQSTCDKEWECIGTICKYPCKEDSECGVMCPETKTCTCSNAGFKNMTACI